MWKKILDKLGIHTDVVNSFVPHSVISCQHPGGLRITSYSGNIRVEGPVRTLVVNGRTLIGLGDEEP